MNTNDIRQKYLDFMKDRGHEILPSASLLPENDPTTLFTGSGMQPMVPYLLGEAHPKGTRLADSQKCFRAQDIDEVGDNRHTTFFEMLGNWSLGDYFKEQQIEWMFEFFDEVVQLDMSRLYVTCFIGAPEYGIEKDVEAAATWKRLFDAKGLSSGEAEIGSEEDGYKRGIKGDERIFYYDGSKNWWSRGGAPKKTPIGDPCGPDSEMFYDFGTPHDPQYGEFCHPNCDCGRFMEIGNNVFMAYRKVADGKFELLEHPNIDHGSGLERIAAARNTDPDVFMIDVFDDARSLLETLSGQGYANGTQPYAFRVIMDHIRAATFLIADGAPPSNKDQGYFTRRLIRRAVRFGKQLGIDQPFCVDITRTFIDNYSSVYAALKEHEDVICAEMKKEEKKFIRTLDKGLKKLERMQRVGEISHVGGGDNLSVYNKVDAKKAFDLYQSYGFPIELIQEELAKKALVVDEKEFNEEMKKHQEISRQGAEKKFKGGLADHSDMSVKYHTATHLLHIALRKVLGDHVEQKGSNITPERLRFDFSHSEKLTPEQKTEVERLVNAAIERNYPVSWQEMPVRDAYDQGVIGLFPDRYDDVVKIYTIGDPAHSGHADPTEPTFSREICGGPHVERTGDMGHFRIQKEEACSSGVRRIKAVLE